MALITSETPAQGFQKSGYRLTLGQEPDSAIDGLYFVDIDSIPDQGLMFGNGETTYSAQFVVEVGYFRGGGDAGGGDRQTVLRNAADDVMRIADVLSNPSNFRGASRVIDKKHAEVWRLQFFVEWRSDLITT